MAVHAPPRGPLGLTGPQKREIKKFLTALLYLAPALVIFAAFVFIPLVQSIRLSTYLTDPLGRAAKFVGLLQYERLFDNDLFMNSLLRSVQFVLYTVPTTLLVAMGLALLGNLRLRRIDLFRMIFSITIAVSGATAALIFSYLYTPSLGWFNYLLSLIGVDAIPWLISDKTALPAVALTTVWLQVGLNTVIILAGMQGIAEELYESAMCDGAGRFRQLWHITLPSIRGTIVLLLVLRMGSVLDNGFEHILLMSNALNRSVSRVFDVYVYENGITKGQYSRAIAAGMFRSTVSVALVFTANALVRRFDESTLL